MPVVLQLDRFGLTELVCRVKGAPAAKQNIRQNVEVLPSIEIPTSGNKVHAKVRIKVSPDPDDSPGYEIDATVVGIFSLADGVDLKEHEEMIRRNAAAILYGVLRGQMTAILGTFHGPRIFLPTVSMDYLFKTTKLESAPVSEAEKKPKKRAPRKRAG